MNSQVAGTSLKHTRGPIHAAPQSAVMPAVLKLVNTSLALDIPMFITVIEVPINAYH